MACFLVSAAEAAVVSALEKGAEKNQEQQENEKENEGAEAVMDSVPLSKKLKWLRNLLLGGSILLAFEHIWHGEVVPWFPFLTAMGDPADAAEMFHEMATVGVCMAVLITGVWFVMCKVADAILKRPDVKEPEKNVA